MRVSQHIHDNSLLHRKITSLKAVHILNETMTCFFYVFFLLNLADSSFFCIVGGWRRRRRSRVKVLFLVLFFYLQCVNIYLFIIIFWCTFIRFRATISSPVAGGVRTLRTPQGASGCDTPERQREEVPMWRHTTHAHCLLFESIATVLLITSSLWLGQH